MRITTYFSGKFGSIQALAPAVVDETPNVIDDHGLAPELDLGIEKDPDLKSLHGDPRFAAHAKEKVAAAQKPR